MDRYSIAKLFAIFWNLGTLLLLIRYKFNNSFHWRMHMSVYSHVILLWFWFRLVRMLCIRSKRHTVNFTCWHLIFIFFFFEVSMPCEVDILFGVVCLCVLNFHTNINDCTCIFCKKIKISHVFNFRIDLYFIYFLSFPIKSVLC